MTTLHRLVLALPVAATALLLAAEASGQTPLVDAARRERARRDAIPPEQKARVYTNEDLRDRGGLTVGSLPAAAAPAPLADGPAGPAAEVPEPVAQDAGAPETGAVRDEEYWRTRMAAARDARAQAALLAEALQNRADGLWAQFTAIDDPVQRGAVERQRMEALGALEGMRADRDRLEQDVRDIEEEARRSGVPPGWLRQAGSR
ncbi:MAG: hypothetical protein J4F37_11890 [Acidobacteria bacterium]|nr:hypothetical protein [Acidobacteriota bacterium]